MMENPYASADMEDALIGHILSGCQIQRRLGQGGMATVYIAHQLSMQRDVAIKIISRDLVQADSIFLSRFEREARIIAQFNHSHILPVYDFKQENGFTYLVMQLADLSLADYIKRQGPLPLNEAARLLHQIGGALDCAHEHGVIHRDLKPANILLDEQKNCLLADFGIAYLANSSTVLTSPGTVVGTLAYISPEQLNGDPATQTSDLYALGVMLYEMLTGRLPFTGETNSAVIVQHLQAKPPSLRKWRADMPEACEAVVLKALSKRPEDRYPTAQAMAQAFSTAVSSAAQPNVLSQDHQNAVSSAVTESPTVVDVIVPTMTEIPAVTLTKHRPRRVWIALIAALIVLGIVGGALLIAGRPQDGNAVAYNEAGSKALAKLDYQTAIQNFKEAIRVDPKYVAAHYNLGVAYEEQGDLKAARAAYETALTLDNRLLLARYRLAELLLDAQEVEPAFQVIEAGIRMFQLGDMPMENDTRKSLTFMLYTTRGRAYYMRGSSNDLALAVNDLQQALAEKDSVDFPAPVYYYLALVYQAQHKADLARQAWLDVLATHDPNKERERGWAVQARTAIAN